MPFALPTFPRGRRDRIIREWGARVVAQHAAQRLEHSFRLTQLIDEFRILRASVLPVLLDAEADSQRAAGTRQLEERVADLARRLPQREDRLSQ